MTTAPTTLYDYYTSKGSTLPTWDKRFSDTSFATAAQSAGITQQAYTGTAEQNNAILAKLNTVTSAPLTTSTSTPITVPQTPTTINSQNTTSTPAINYNTPANVPIFPVATIPEVKPTAVPALTPTQQQAQELTSRITQLNTDYAGKADYQTQQNTAQGIDQKTQAVTDLGTQLQGLQNEAAAIPLQLQQGAADRGVVTPVLGRQENSRLRTNAIAALGVSTLLNAAHGNLTTAQATADRAVSQKFDPIQAQITSSINNLNLLIHSPQYSVEEKAQAQTQLNIEKQKQDELDRQRTTAEEINKLAITAAANSSSFKATAEYPTLATALSAMSKATSTAQAVSIASSVGLTPTAASKTQVININGQSTLINSETGATIKVLGTDPAKTSTVEVNGRKLLINDATGATIKDLGAASTSGSTGTAAERAASALSQYASAFVAGAKLPSGIPVLDAEGFLTPEAFKAAIADVAANGLTREQFLQQFGYLMVGRDGTISPNYGLTPAEISSLKATVRA